jgi:hypothetical protein
LDAKFVLTVSLQVTVHITHSKFSNWGILSRLSNVRIVSA